jgi:hypothetical protein|tara:strand:+ start:525 stop:911 length:387 start_codon:yes stop_codon:yes gene_type:complete
MINKIFLGFTAATYGYLGGWALFDPSSYVTAVGLTINTDLGSAEIRAVYGGINFLVGISAFVTLINSRNEKTFFTILLFLISGILLGRIISLIYGEYTSPFIGYFTAFEIVYFVFLVSALRKLRNRIF